MARIVVLVFVCALSGVAFSDELSTLQHFTVGAVIGLLVVAAMPMGVRR